MKIFRNYDSTLNRKARILMTAIILAIPVGTFSGLAMAHWGYPPILIVLAILSAVIAVGGMMTIALDMIWS